MEFTQHSFPQTKVLKTILGEIETIRIKRQTELKHQVHSSLKRFTQQELNDEVCKTYKNLLTGRSKRLPSRQSIMEIANYLECTFNERNDLLLAAGYLPEKNRLEGCSLELALEQAHRIMNLLPFPSFIATHTLEIHAINESFRRLFEIPFETLPKHQRNMVHFHFNPELSIRSRSTFDVSSFEKWKEHAIYGIQLFKTNNVLSRYDTEYQRLVEEFFKVGDFSEFWDKEFDIPNRKEVSQSKIFMARMGNSSDFFPIQLQQIHISMSSYM
ncbi:hypothetical protein [Peribacillus frigoritolerans]|uniref:MmyB family transcriptional regulator n=1 Tax=Peribacillus frigoritolerans TaxID=450367 RepID=UPI0023DAFFFE|nr:hypothetical protein [Peribacillus frigoritolerans]MDF1998164.1 hypothetical protein [Peribacillus frigoritolerans]